MDEKYSSIRGYTDSEVDYYFKKHIESWATTKNILYSTLRKDLKTWYNGYCFKENTPTIYSPFTFTLAIKKNELQNFWFESATPHFLLSELAKEERKSELKLLELDQLEGSWDLLQTFEIENIPLPALLVQMGYLTIDVFNPLSRNYTLRYPNLEVRSSLNKHLLATVTKQTTTEIKSQKYYEPLLLLEDAILGLGISFLRKKASGKEKSVFEVSYALEEIKK